MVLDDTIDTGHFDLAQAQHALRTSGVVSFDGLSIYSSVIHGRRFTFAVDRKRDPIQRQHRNGRFYEEEELQAIKMHFPLGGVFVDIGSNIGNHSLFVAGFLNPRQIIPFEPNPVAYKLLLANVVLNDFVDLFDVSRLGVGVSDKPGGGYAMEDRDRNLGAAKMQPGEGDLRVVRGDDALADLEPDFIKIDIEGMEIEALNGLRQTLARSGPTMMVEVARENDEAFHAFLSDVNYSVAKRIGRNRFYKNYVVVPATHDADPE